MRRFFSIWMLYSPTIAKTKITYESSVFGPYRLPIVTRLLLIEMYNEMSFGVYNGGVINK